MARRVRRRDVVLGGLTVGITAPWLLAACDDDEGEGDAGTSPARDLLTELEADGDVAFEELYSATGRDGGVALVVGTAGSNAVGYLCDPAGPAQWLTGTVDGEVVSLEGVDGASVNGTVRDAAIDCTLTGSGAHDGEFRLESTGATTLSRQTGVDGASPVGGLIIDGFVATGSFGAPTIQPQQLVTTTTTSNLRLAVDGATLGLRVVAGSTLDISLTVTPSRSLTARERSQLQALLTENQEHIRAVAQAIADRTREAQQKNDCTKILAVVAAVVLVVVAVVLAAFTFGASGALVALAVIAASAIIGSTITDLAGAEIELNALLGASIGAAIEFVAANDQTSGQLILQTVRQATQRPASSTTTTTAVPPRFFPPPGNISLVLR